MEAIMDILIWIGAGLSLIGVIGIFYSIIVVTRAKRSTTDDAELREKLAKVLPLNLAALFVSAIGLMIVVVGILLG
jgi:hypothetical protein